MKKALIFFVIIALGSCSVPINTEVHSDFEDQTIMLGEVNWDGLTSEPFNEWFTPNYLAYNVDSTTLTPLASKIGDIKIITFMGTWCSDSKAQVPQFYKILDYLKYDLSGMKVTAIDRAEDGLIIADEDASYKIVHVPTFIFYRDGKEIGRITEYPVKTIEKDMVDIIGG